jgi:hypothetical protein
MYEKVIMILLNTRKIKGGEGSGDKRDRGCENDQSTFYACMEISQ